MLGISIGCAAIVVALSLGDSAQSYANNEVNAQFKMDEITVTPNEGVSQGGGEGATKTGANSNVGKLTDQKLDIIKNFKHVIAAAPFQDMGYVQMETVDNKVGDLNIIATDLSLLTKYDFSFQQGAPSEQAGSVVLNYGATIGLLDTATRDGLIEKLTADPYNAEVSQQYQELTSLPSEMYQQRVQFRYVNYDPSSSKNSYLSSPLQVAGVLKVMKGVDPQMAMYDKKAYISRETFAKLSEEFNLNKNSSETVTYNSAIIKVDKQENLLQIEALIKKLTLNTSTNLYQLESLNSTFAMIKRVALGVGVFILIIASISIIVAMTMSTHQRRRQIGIMKVLGANMSQIRIMFIMESALLGLLGGMLGIGFSYLIVTGINKLVGSAAGGGMGTGQSLVISIPLSTIPVGIIFAIMTGVISGIYPAISASRTNALTAIRRD
ncbi:FtsX-like permease family protein [Paenibacillus sp. LC-T2]|uniref:FtsX-like permease family protein n=2 Tax=Paenibacillus monticola TaxID=2666075 RepID=A0A7X2H7U6_9BACL|nr:ABC transporter permease [Paenibacillus monticola]MRN55137.1 FtsX-like permease family protein [Paenibacillus monticola]